MGAALTYARRYALFTLVGIAGEDDLDAPDLPGTKLEPGTVGRGDPDTLNGYAGAIDSSPPYQKGSPRKPRPSRPILNAEESAALRDRLAAELASLDSFDVAVEWARGSIGAKNTLVAKDAGAVEAAFRDRMRALELPPGPSAEDQVGGSPTAASAPGWVVVEGASLEETRQAAIGRRKGGRQRSL